MSAAMSSFCSARVLTLILRSAWSTHQFNISLAIAANIFVGASTLIVYMVNLIFTQRILRSTHPSIGWHWLTNIVCYILLSLVVLCLVLVITFSVLSTYSLDQEFISNCRDIQLAAATYLLFFVFLPIFVLPFSYMRRYTAILEPRSQESNDTMAATLSSDRRQLGLGARGTSSTAAPESQVLGRVCAAMQMDTVCTI